MALINAYEVDKTKRREKLKRMLNKSPCKKLILRIPAPLHKKFKQAVNNNDTNMNKVLEECIVNYLKNNKE